MKGTKARDVVIAVVLLLVMVLIFWISFDGHPKNTDNQQGLVYDAQGVKIDMNISVAAPSMKPVERNLYGSHAAKLLDEAAGAQKWQSQISSFAADLDAAYVRYPAGGLSKYAHVWTDTMSQPLTDNEKRKLVNGNEIRGNGYILADRVEEEARGNEGELSEITTPRARYGGQSYLEGLQNLQPHNFIRDFVEIAKAGGSNALYVANITYGTPKEALQQIKFLQDSGVRVLGVECGNEQYLKANEWWQSGNPEEVVPESVANYLDRCDEFKTVIAGSYPKMEFAVTAAPKKDFDEEGAQSGLSFNDVWNIELNEQMPEHGYKNYVMHFYAPFVNCQDEIEVGDQDEIFNCGYAELLNLRKPENVSPSVVSFPAVLNWYRTNFPGKKMWLTEWNINQEHQNGTGGMFGNSMLHAIFTQNILTMMNDANAKYGNFITFANYHTFVNQEWNTMIQKRKMGNPTNTEPADTGDFVRRTPYFAYKTMKDIFLKGLTPLTVNTSAHPGELDGLTMHAYEDKKDKRVYVVTSNMSGVSVGFQNANFGQINLANVSGVDSYFLHGPSLSASRGATEYGANNPSNQAREMSATRQSIGSIRIPPYSVGYLVIDVSPRLRTTINGSSGRR